MSGKTITSNSIELKMGGSIKQGIYILIKSKKTGEVVLRE